MKFTGIYPGQLHRLHEALRKGKEELDPLIPARAHSGRASPALLTSYFDSQHGTYTIELKLIFRWWPSVENEQIRPGSQGWDVSRALTDKVFDILEIYPDRADPE